VTTPIAVRRRRAPAKPMSFHMAIVPFLMDSVQLIHYKKQGYRLKAWAWDNREYYLVKNGEERTVKMTQNEHERLWNLYNAYFYEGVYSDAFARVLSAFTGGRITQRHLINRLSGFI